jgi:hypothetical protein
VKKGAHRGDYRSRELFTAELMLKLSLRKRKVFELDVNLAALTWRDALSSGINLTNPKNLFLDLPTGDYYMFVQLPIRSRSSSGNHDADTIASNEVAISIR